MVQALYLALMLMLYMTFGSTSYWGSRILLIVLSLNFIMPILLLYSFSDDLTSVISIPSGTDELMASKGEDMAFLDVLL
jgi:hypothetical protein